MRSASTPQPGTEWVMSLWCAFLLSSGALAGEWDNVEQSVMERAAVLSKIEVAFDFREEHYPASTQALAAPAASRSETEGQQWVVVSGSTTGESRFMRAGELVRFERRETSDPTQQAMPLLPSPDIQSFSSSRVEHRFGNNGKITNTDRLPADSIIDLALGFRAKGFDQWLTGQVLAEGTFHNNDHGTVKFEWLPSDSKYGNRRQDVWTFDPKLGYALTRYELRWKPEWSNDFVTDTTIVTGDFRLVSGVQVPFYVSAKSYFNQAGAEPFLTHAVEIAVDSYKIGELEENDEAFLIEWPDGAIVLDERNGQTYVVKDGPKQLTDEVLQVAFRRGLPDDNDRASSRRRWGVLLIVNSFAAIALLGYFVFNRFSKRAR